MGSEILQLLVVAGLFVVALGLWLKIVYLPARTLERWEDWHDTPPPDDEERRAGPRK